MGVVIAGVILFGRNADPVNYDRSIELCFEAFQKVSDAQYDTSDAFVTNTGHNGVYTSSVERVVMWGKKSGEYQVVCTYGPYSITKLTVEGKSKIGQLRQIEKSE